MYYAIHNFHKKVGKVGYLVFFVEKH